MNISKSTLFTILGAAGIGIIKKHTGSASNVSPLPLQRITFKYKIRVRHGLNDNGSLMEAEYYWGQYDSMFHQLIEMMPSWMNIEIDDKYEDHPENDTLESKWRTEFIEHLEDWSDDTQESIKRGKEEIADYLVFDDDYIMEGEYETIEDFVDAIPLDTAALTGDFWNKLSQNVTFIIDMMVISAFEAEKIEEVIDQFMEEFEDTLNRTRADSMWWETSIPEDIEPPIDSFARKPKLSRLRRR